MSENAPTCAGCRYYEQIPPVGYKEFAHGCWYARKLFIRASNRDVPPACHLFDALCAEGDTHE